MNPRANNLGEHTSSIILFTMFWSRRKSRFSQDQISLEEYARGISAHLLLLLYTSFLYHLRLTDSHSHPRKTAN